MIGTTFLELVAEADLKTVFGPFRIRGYRFKGQDCVALHVPHTVPKAGALVRVQSCCLFGETFNSTDCDCRWQVHHSLQRIADAGAGIFVYLYQEGRGIGILEKIRAYEVQQKFKCDTVEAFQRMGFETADLRSYDAAVAILKDYGTDNIRLLTNNPNKAEAFAKSNFTVTTHPLLPEASDFKNISSRAGDFAGLLSYLETKRSKMHQDIDAKLLASLREEINKGK